MKNVRDIGEAMIAAKVEQMTDDTSKMFLTCLMMQKAREELPGEFTQGFSYQVLSKRLAYHGVPATPYAMAFFCAQAINVGTLILYATVLKVLSERNGGQEVTIDDIAKAFPWGFPTEEEVHRIWEAQKVGRNNMVDQEAAWA